MQSSVARAVPRVNPPAAAAAAGSAGRAAAADGRYSTVPSGITAFCLITMMPSTTEWVL